MDPYKSCWDVDTPLTIDPSSVTPGSHRLASKFHAQEIAIQSTHVANKPSDANHVTHWKDNFNTLNIPKQEYLCLLVGWPKKWSALRTINYFLTVWILLTLRPRLDCKA